MPGAADHKNGNRDDDGTPPSLVSALIEADLARVFRFLCGYAARAKLRRLERELHLKSQAMASHAANATTNVPEAWGAFATDAYEIMEVLSEGETEQVDALRREILAVTRDVGAAKTDGPITCNDLCQLLKDMSLPLSKVEVEHMIWEVDEDMDGCVSMDEFKTMFSRCVQDHHGVEPTQLYHLVVVVGEIAQRSNVRHNSELLTRQLSSLFGKEAPESLVSLPTYWAVVNTTIPNLFN
ncbi:hypothetical protein DYB37_006327 [Aphanomyces astaci]|uniref:EF-hand domain-containing protein n=1 Tax=Aphanomyces astaci TaxID=112090 RepID=A0A3R7ETP7_APHAT|nr:hypothetical protein DYB37_006327 [Aphanomyces astaci]